MKMKTNIVINIVSFFIWMLWLLLTQSSDFNSEIEIILLLAFPFIYSLYNVIACRNKKDFVISNIIFCASNVAGHYIAGMIYHWGDIDVVNIFSVISVIYILMATIVFYLLRAFVERFKHKVIAVLSIVVAFAMLCTAIAFWIDPNLNKFKLKSVENNALEYIHKTYPEFEVANISVVHEWESNWYVVDYDDGNGDSRTVTFDHTGEKVSFDNYIHDKAFGIEYDYSESVENQIMEALKKELSIETHYILIEVDNIIGKDKELAFGELDISKQPITCSIGIIGSDNLSTLEFAKAAREIYGVVSALDLPIKKTELSQQNSPDSRFDIVCPENMSELSIEEIERLVEK